MTPEQRAWLNCGGYDKPLESARRRQPDRVFLREVIPSAMQLRFARRKSLTLFLLAAHLLEFSSYFDALGPEVQI